MNEVTRNKHNSIKLDHSTFMEVVKYSPLVSIDLIVRNTQNEVLLGFRTIKSIEHVESDEHHVARDLVSVRD